MSEEFVERFIRRYAINCKTHTPMREITMCGHPGQKIVSGPTEVSLILTLDALNELVHLDTMYSLREEEAERRQKIPAAMAAWEHYQTIMKLTK